MMRLVSTIRWDVQLQLRNGFYYAAAFVAIIFILILSQVEMTQETLALLLPFILVQNIAMNTFYFLAGLVLLEKRENTLEGLIVTPLRQDEYLASKLITLIALSILETTTVVVIIYGFGFNLFWWLIAVIFMGTFFGLVGFIIVARYDSINSFLLPSVLITMFLTIPFVDYFGLWESWIIYLHPFQAQLLLLRAAFEPLATWKIIYAVLYGILWIAIVYVWSKRVFYRFVILKEGVR